ncbi:hypothetical protein GN156_11075 [bacterium LRH843]|nr:hypothetical protein [bacterium LRH843]
MGNVICEVVLDVKVTSLPEGIQTYNRLNDFNETIEEVHNVGLYGIFIKHYYDIFAPCSEATDEIYEYETIGFKINNVEKKGKVKKYTFNKELNIIRIHLQVTIPESESQKKRFGFEEGIADMFEYSVDYELVRDIVLNDFVLIKDRIIHGMTIESTSYINHRSRDE